MTPLQKLTLEILNDCMSIVEKRVSNPVYKKVGFRVVAENAFFKRVEDWNEQEVSENVILSRGEHYANILRLDREITGENREGLLKDHLASSLVYVEGDEVKGCFLPTLKEGAIFADSDEAGVELMKVKYSKVDRAVLPSTNVVGVGFLEQNGFERIDAKGTRMVLGDDVNWKAEKVFSRIAGNFG